MFFDITMKETCHAYLLYMPAVLRKNIHFTSRAACSCRNTCPGLFNVGKNRAAAIIANNLQ